MKMAWAGAEIVALGAGVADVWMQSYEPYDEIEVRQFMLFDDVMKIYMTAKTHRSKSRDLHALERLRPYFTGRKVAELRRADVRGYVSLRRDAGVSESTVTRELGVFSAAISFVRVKHENSALPNPVRKLRLSSGNDRVRWLTEVEACALLRVARTCRRPQLAAFIRLALGTGCRKNELLGLGWKRVDVERGMFWPDAKHTKNGKRRVVPLNQVALKALADLREWGQENSPGARWVFAMESGADGLVCRGHFAAPVVRREFRTFGSTICDIHSLRGW